MCTCTFYLCGGSVSNVAIMQSAMSRRLGPWIELGVDAGSANVCCAITTSAGWDDARGSRSDRSEARIRTRAPLAGFSGPDVTASS